jgi:hypothetical protein
MSELLQEYVDSRSQRLRVDRAAGVIRGVKLLGLTSRNGRRYREYALAEAVALYEGAKVNVNHPKGHPLAPRDYQDRLGIVRGVEFRTAEGLFGDLHFNPRHALSEQLVWDAEHAPQNVGMSHNVLARTKREGDETVVEAITKVQSIDLVADPATTTGLYEQEAHAGVAGVEPKASPQSTSLGARQGLDPSHPFTVDALTLEELRLHRPDLVRALEQSHVAQLESLRQELDAMTAREAAAKRRERIVELLKEHDLPLPADDRRAADYVVSERFMQTLVSAPDDATLRQFVEEWAEVVRWARSATNGHRSTDQRPKSRDQLESAFMKNGRPTRTAAEFAAAVRGE